jgi:hypothetical protein
VELITNGRVSGAAMGGACDPKHWQCVWHEVQMK